MRAILLSVGALLFLAYPLVLLLAIAGSLDQAERKPETAAIILTPRSSNQWLEDDAAQPSRTGWHNPAIRKSGD